MTGKMTFKSLLIRADQSPTLGKIEHVIEMQIYDPDDPQRGIRGALVLACHTDDEKFPFSEIFGGGKIFLGPPKHLKITVESV